MSVYTEALTVGANSPGELQHEYCCVPVKRLPGLAAARETVALAPRTAGSREQRLHGVQGNWTRGSSCLNVVQLPK